MDFEIMNNSLIKYNGNKETVFIPEGIVEIKEKAFENSVLKTVIFPKSLLRIEDSAFFKCNFLENLIFESFNNIEIEGAFYKEAAEWEDLIVPIPFSHVILKEDYKEIKSDYNKLLEKFAFPVGKVNIFDKNFPIESENVEIEIGKQKKINEIKKTSVISILTVFFENNDFEVTLNEVENKPFIFDIILKKDDVSYLFEIYADYNDDFFMTLTEKKVSNIEDINRLFLPFMTGEWSENYQNIKGNVIFLKGIKKINSNSFENCTNLTNIIIPEGVEEIGDYVFKNCKSLKEIFIPESILRTEKIGRTFIKGCVSLIKIKSPKKDFSKNFNTRENLRKQGIRTNLFEEYDEGDFVLRWLSGSVIPWSAFNI